MAWLLWAFVGAGMLHALEEFVYPGGFLTLMKSFSRVFAPFVTVRFAVGVNTLFILAAANGSRAPVLALSVASLLFLNGVLHVAVATRKRGYAPGLVTALFLYLPLSVAVYLAFARTGQISLSVAGVAIIIGAACQAVPVAYLAVAAAVPRRGARRR